MKLGYARCSTLDQNLDWQIDALTKEGCDRIFQEKFTGTRKDRPELLRMMDMLREGDTVIICELTRLSRSVKDLFDLVEQVEKAGANIKSLKEPWLDTTTPQGDSFLPSSAELASSNASSSVRGRWKDLHRHAREEGWEEGLARIRR